MAAVYKDSFGVQYTEIVKPEVNDAIAKNGVWANQYYLDEINLRLNVISGFWLEDMLRWRPPATRTRQRTRCSRTSRISTGS
jgi:hypothetical protein